MFCLWDNLRFHKNFVRCQYLCFFFSSFRAHSLIFFLFLLILLFVFFPRTLSNGRSFERCNDAWYYVIQLVIPLCNNFFLIHISIFNYLIIRFKNKSKMSLGRNIMCKRTVTSILVLFRFKTLRV